MSRCLLVFLTLFASAAFAGDIDERVDENRGAAYVEQTPAGKGVPEVELPAQLKEALEVAQWTVDREGAPWATQEVWGTYALIFLPSGQADLPRPPLDMTLVVRRLPGPGEYKFRISDPHPQWTVEEGRSSGNFARIAQDFNFSIMPGTYEISLVEVNAPSLDVAPVALPTESPRFAVPEGRCVYVGHIGTRYLRLPSGSFDQDKAFVLALSRKLGRDFVMIHMDMGSLVLVDSFVALPSDQEPRRGLGGGGRAYDEAVGRGCIVAPAKF